MLFVDTSDSNSGGSFFSDEGTESGFVFHNAIGNLHLSAQSWKPDHQLNRVNIVGNDDEFSFLLFDKSSDVVDTELEEVWFFSSCQKVELQLSSWHLPSWHLWSLWLSCHPLWLL